MFECEGCDIDVKKMKKARKEVNDCIFFCNYGKFEFFCVENGVVE